MSGPDMKEMVLFPPPRAHTGSPTMQGWRAKLSVWAAWEKGLGTVIMGIFEEAKVKEALQIPETESVSALIALGYPEEVPEAPKRNETELLLKIVK